MERVTWFAVDAGGCDLATGRPPRGHGATSPRAALADAPVAAWPITILGSDGRHLDVGQTLGRGGERVTRLVDRLLAEAEPPTAARRAWLARTTPAGVVDLPVEVVSLTSGFAAAAGVDEGWLESVAHRRAAARSLLVRGKRNEALEAALNITMLVATERLDPPDGDLAAHAASGGQLWLLGGAVAWALTGTPDDPFAPWAELVVAGFWPVGPSDGRLVLASATA